MLRLLSPDGREQSLIDQRSLDSFQSLGAPFDSEIALSQSLWPAMSERFARVEWWRRGERHYSCNPLIEQAFHSSNSNRCPQRCPSVLLLDSSIKLSSTQPVECHSKTIHDYPIRTSRESHHLWNLFWLFGFSHG